MIGVFYAGAQSVPKYPGCNIDIYDGGIVSDFLGQKPLQAISGTIDGKPGLSKSPPDKLGCEIIIFNQ